MRSTTFCLQTLLGLAILSACGCGANTGEGAQGGAGGIGAGGIGGAGGQGGAGSPCVVGAPCSDGDACTPADVCVDGVCVGQDAVTCTPSKVCAAATCNPQTGACEESPALDGAVCGQNGACQGGSCVSAKLHVKVLDKEGLPIPGAKVTYNGVTLPVDFAGSVEIDAPESHMVAKVEAPSYAPASAVAKVPPGTNVNAITKLLPTGPRMFVDMTTGGTVGTKKVRVTLPPGSVVDSAGVPVSDIIGVTVTPIDPTGADVAAMPGPLTGTNMAGESVLIASNGMAEFSLWQGSQPLQLAPNASATIEMVLPDVLQSAFKAGDSIPAWYFDLDAGTWKQDGIGLVTDATSEPGKLAWVAQVKHFTWWNADFQVGGLEAIPAPEALDCVTVKVVKELTGGGFQDINGAIVRAVGTSVAVVNGSNPSGVLVSEMSTGATSSGEACVHVVRPAWWLPDTIESQISVTVPEEGFVISGVEILGNGTGQGFNVDTSVAPLVVTTNRLSGERDNCVTKTHCLNLRVKMRPPACIKGTFTPLPMGLGGLNGTIIHGTYNDFFSPLLGPRSISTQLTSNNSSYCFKVPQSVPVKLTASKTNSVGETFTYTGPIISSPNPGSCSNQATCVTQNIALTKAQGQATTGAALGSSGTQIIKDLATNSNGDVALVGYFLGSATFGMSTFNTGNQIDADAFVVRIDKDDTVSWAKQLGGIGLQQATGVAFDSLGNIVVTGSFENELKIDQITHTSSWPGTADGYVAKFSPSGTYLWSKTFGGFGDQFPEDVVVDTSPKLAPEDALYIDNILVVGHYTGALGSLCGSCAQNINGCNLVCDNAVGKDAFALKFYATGDRLLGGTFGGAGDQRALAAAIDRNNGDVYVVGDYQQNIVVGGMPVFQTGAGGVDPFIAKATSLGTTFQWVKSLGIGAANDSAPQSAVSVAVGKNGQAFVAGNFQGKVLSGCEKNSDALQNINNLAADDIFVAEYSAASGNCIWRSHIAGTLEQAVNDVVVLQDGNLLVSGSSSNGLMLIDGKEIASVGNEDFFLAKFDVTNFGPLLWSKRWGDENKQGYAYGAQLGEFPGGLVLAGVFGGTGTMFKFGGVQLTPNSDGSDIAFVRLVQ